jgi:hypothetical protein
VLGTCETLAMQQGRELIRRTIETALAQQEELLKKKRRRSGPARAAPASGTADARPASCSPRRVR